MGSLPRLPFHAVKSGLFPGCHVQGSSSSVLDDTREQSIALASFHLKVAVCTWPSFITPRNLIPMTKRLETGIRAVAQWLMLLWRSETHGPTCEEQREASLSWEAANLLQ